MLPNVTGMRLDDARRLLEDSGAGVESVEPSQPPPGTGHPFHTGVELETYVATAWETESGAARLRVVSVPVAGSAG